MISLLLVTFQDSSHREERPLPTTAQIAMQQGEHVAKSIKNILNGQALPTLNMLIVVLYVH